MLNTKKSAVYIKKVLCIVAIVTVLFSCFAIPVKAVALAATTSYSDVLADLSVDSTFSTVNYPIVENDYSLSIIQIAESEQQELIIYVYQPCTNKDFRANYISMSTQINDEIDPNIYSLTFCNLQGTLYKYIVNDFTVDFEAEVRYYEIYSIYRPFDSSIDRQADADNEVNSVVYSVSAQWKFGTINGNSFNERVNITTFEVADKFVGYCRYSNGVHWAWEDIPESVDCHFVAFNLRDQIIDELYEVDVFYATQTYDFVHPPINPPNSIDNDLQERYIEYRDDYTLQPVKTIYADNHSESQGGFRADKYSWSRIRKRSDFVEEESSPRMLYEGVFVDLKKTYDFGTAALNALNRCEWVIMFHDSPFNFIRDPETHYYYGDGTRVTDVSILRLKFKTNGVTYNVGIVDNMQTGSFSPINQWKVEVDLTEPGEILSKILGVIGIVLIIAIIIALAVVIEPIGKLFKGLFKIIVAVISAPFKFFAWLFGGSSRKRSRSPTYKKR